MSLRSITNTPPNVATQAELNTEVQARQDADSTLQTNIDTKTSTTDHNAALSRITSLESTQGTGRIAYQTRTLLYADLAHDVNTLAEVTNDSTSSYNGTYIKVGASGSGSWLKSTNDISGRLSTTEIELQALEDAYAADQARFFDAPKTGNLVASNSRGFYRYGSQYDVHYTTVNGEARSYYCEWESGTIPIINNGYSIGLGNGLYNWKEFQLIYNHAGTSRNVMRHHAAGNFDHRGLIFDEPTTFNSYTKARLDSQGWRTIRSVCNQNQKGRFVIEESSESQATSSDENMIGFVFGYDGQSNAGNYNKGFLGTIDSGTQHLSMEFDRNSGNITLRASIDFNGQAVKGLNLVPEYKTQRWAFTTDSHAYFTNAGGNQRISDLCQEIGNHRPSMVVHGGDWVEKPVGTSGSSISESGVRRLNRYKSYTGCPWFHVAGNHDVATPVSFIQPTDVPSQPARIQRNEDFYEWTEDEYVLETYELNTGNDVQQKGYYRKWHRPSGVHHIVLNACEAIDSPQTGWYPLADQMTWLQNELNSLDANDRVIIYTHIPPRGGFNYNGWRAAERDQLHTMLTGFSGKVLAVLSGHIHDNNRITVDGIDYIRMVNSEGDTKDDPYNEDNTNRLAYALLEWKEATSTLSIVGFNGQSSYEINVNN